MIMLISDDNAFSFDRKIGHDCLSSGKYTHVGKCRHLARFLFLLFDCATGSSPCRRSVTPMPNPVFPVTMLHACQAYRRTYSSVPHCEAVLLERQPFAFAERVGCSVTIVVIGRHDAVWKDSTAMVPSRWWSWL